MADDTATRREDIKRYLTSATPRSRSVRDQLEERAEAADTKVKSRADLTKVLWDELKYDPLARKDLNWKGKAKELQYKALLTPLKAFGAATQREESAIANAMKTAQDMGPSSALGTIKKVGRAALRGLTSEPTHEYGDVLARSRIPGLSNPYVAGAGGLGLSALTPGPAEAIKAVSGVTRGIGRGVRGGLGRFFERTGKQYVQALGATEGGAERAFARKFADIPSDTTEKVALWKLDKLQQRALAGAQKLEDDTQEMFGRVLAQESGKRVAVEIVDEVGNNTLTQGVKQLLGNADVTNVEGVAINMPGAPLLSSIIKDIDKTVVESGGYLTVGDLRRWMKPLRTLGNNERLGEIYAAANELRSNLAKVVATASPEMGQASSKYSSMVKTLHGVEGKTVGALPTLRMSSTTGAVPLAKEGYYGIEPRARQSLERLGTRVRPTYDFLEDLKNASYVSELSSDVAKKGVSLAALLTFAVKNPLMFAGLYAAGGLFTPRVVGKAYQGLYKNAGRIQSVIGSPGGQAISEIINRFTASGAVHGATRDIFSQGGQSE
jgi:hypothetical protein